MRIAGICLVVFGILALAFGGFSYTTRERVIDAGPLKVDTNKEHNVPIAPIAGGVAVVAGLALIVLGAKARV